MYKISVYNIKGGVGKTTAAVNLAHLATRDGLLALLWDLDPQGGASFLLRAKPRSKPVNKRLIKGKKGVLQLVRQTALPGLDVLPASLADRDTDVVLDGARKANSWVGRTLKSVVGVYDIAILDCPPSMSALSRSVLAASDLILVPIVPAPLSLRSVDQIREAFSEQGLDASRILPFFSMVDRRKSLHRHLVARRGTSDSVCETYIPSLSAVEKMSIHREPVTSRSPRSRAAEAFVNLWNEVRRRLD